MGVALALRSQQNENSEPVVVERVVKEYLPVPQSLPPTPAERAITPLPDLEAITDPVPVAPTELKPLPEHFTSVDELMQIPTAALGKTPELPAPFIADPEVEKWVADARAARVRDDLAAAILKLEAAEEKAPNDPNVLYQFGEIFEAVGNYDKAADYYEKVYGLGPEKAGSLLELAALKLSHGFEHAKKMEGKLALGRVRQFNDKSVEKGEKIILTIPVLAAPGEAIDLEKLKVKVSFFDKYEDKIEEEMPNSKHERRWVTEPTDWSEGEELLRVTYFIPPGDTRDEHLLGARKHFGQIVELQYDSELLDQQAWPRLLARQRNIPEANPLFIPKEYLPEDLNPGNPLLPPPLPK